jgi:hypothetical protein
MTKMLKKALAEVAKLSEEEQNALAAWLLEELASERRWERLFASSSDKLAALSDAALTEHKRGHTHTTSE